jgi:uncharacterized DUF497 family protein
MRFEWDERKNAINRRKHGLDFSEIERLADAIFEPDESTEEERWRLTGIIGATVVVAIVAFPAEERVRVISMRKATIYEQEHYFKKGFPRE